MKNCDKLKSPTLAKDNRRFQKKNIFIIQAVFLAVFLLFPIKIYALTEAYKYNPITTSSIDCATIPCATFFKAQDFCNLANYKVWYKTSDNDCYFNFNIYPDFGVGVTPLCSVNDVYRPADNNYFDINFTDCNLDKNNFYSIWITNSSLSSSTYCDLGISNLGYTETSTWASMTSGNYISLSFSSLQFKSSISFDETSPCSETATTTCPDCTNNCFCGGTSGATTSTSTIINDLFLKDNDISTIKSVSGLVGNKNYTIYYFPFLLFIYIFIILIVCLSVIYIFKIIRKK